MGAERIAQRLTRLFNETVTIYPWTGQDSYGQSTYGAGEDYRARIQRGSMRTNGENQAMPSLHKVIIGEAVKVDPRDKLVLPEEHGTRDSNGDFEQPNVKIIEVNYLSDSRSHIATVVMCGRG